MKKVFAVFVLLLSVSFASQAQDKMMKDTKKKISLEQTKGAFTQKQVTVPAGTYVFEIANNNVGKDVGFVLVKKGADISNPDNHIKTAYVTEVVANNTTGHSNPTTLEKGTYVYFCPLNNTATDNTLIVE